jgi:hypothetical protein
LLNFQAALSNYKQINSNVALHVIADACNEELKEFLATKREQFTQYYETDFKHGAGSFRFAFQKALELPLNTIVYFVEDDYVHTPESLQVIFEGLRFGAFSTGYDHPDKYQGSVPFTLKEGCEELHTKVYCGSSCHYKTSNSTTMTFATTVSKLHLCKHIMEPYVTGTHPFDFQMFLHIRAELDQYVVVALPGVCTHGETLFLGAFRDWKSIMALTDTNSERERESKPIDSM